MATAKQDDFSIKGAALRQEDQDNTQAKTADVSSLTTDVPAKPDNSLTKTQSRASSAELEAGEVDETQIVTNVEATDTTTHRWCKCACDPAAPETYGKDHYFLHFDTHEARWDEPDEPYWVWDATKQSVDEHGLRYPASSKQPERSAPRSDKAEPEPDPEYRGYNPKIHGAYDPNADYAQWHKRKRDVEDDGPTASKRSAIDPVTGQPLPPGTKLPGSYVREAHFNRVTGSFQSADKGAENHSDYAKSGRQMSAFFDIDSAANSNHGRSLKAERQQQKLTKKEIKELQQKKKDKKAKKLMEWLKN